MVDVNSILSQHDLKVREVSADQYKLPKEFQLTILLVFSMALLYVITIYFVTMRARIGIYRRSFMRQFDEIHKKAFPGKTKAPEFGYPDTGNGYFSKKLPYADWFKMNNA